VISELKFDNVAVIPSAQKSALVMPILPIGLVKSISCVDDSSINQVVELDVKEKSQPKYPKDCYVQTSAGKI